MAQHDEALFDEMLAELTEEGRLQLISSAFHNGVLPENAKTLEKLVKIYEKRGQHLQAAQLSAELGDYERARINYERAGDFGNALTMAEKAGNSDKVELYRHATDFLSLPLKRSQHETDMTKLRKVEGWSFEDVTKIMNEKRIPYTTIKKPEMSAYYFRNSCIYSQPRYERSVTENFGLGRSPKNGGRTYFARYQITPEFKFPKFNGLITFHDGLLVERVFIDFPKR